MRTAFLRRAALRGRAVAALLFLGASACEIPVDLDLCLASCTGGTVSVTSDGTALAVGGTLQLSLSDGGGGAKWTSGAPSIATVSGSGVVTGVSAGRVIIDAFRSGSPSVGASIDIDVFPALCTADSAQGPIAFGDTILGTISAASCGVVVRYAHGVARGARAAGLRFLMPSAGLLRLDITSSGFRPDLLVTDASLAGTGGSGYFATSSAYSVFALPAGELIAWATSTFPPGAGPFTLEATVVAECDPAAATSDSIRPGQSLTGTLERSDCHTRHNGPGDVWRLVLESGERVFIGLGPLSSSLFADVQYVGAAGVRSLVTPEGLLLDAGVHTLLVQGHGGGDYQLTVSR